jgi:hypothetical protein
VATSVERAPRITDSLVFPFRPHEDVTVPCMNR